MPGLRDEQLVEDVGDVHVLAEVVVEVADGDGHAVDAEQGVGFLGDIGEGFAVVAEETAGVGAALLPLSLAR